MRNPQRAKRVKKLKRIRKWKKRSLAILIAFIALICFLWILIYTSLGVKIITGVLEKVMPEIKIEQTNGALNNLEVQGFSMNLDGIEVSVGKAELSLSGLCLIKGKICVKNLNAEDVTVNINTDAIADSDPNKPIGRISMPLPIELRAASLSNVNVNVNDMQFGLSSFSGSATWINEKIYVFPVTAMNVKAIFSDLPTAEKESATKVTNESQSISEKINQIFNQPLIASLPEVNIPLDIYVNSLKGSNWLLHMGGEDYVFNNVTIQANTENNFIRARLVQADAITPYGDASAVVKGQITLGGNWPVMADVQMQTQSTSTKNSTELISHITGDLLGSISAQLNISGLNQADINAKIDFIEHYMPVSLRAKGKHLQWPIKGKSSYQLDNFDVDLSGSVKDYHFNAKGDANINDLPIEASTDPSSTLQYPTSLPVKFALQSLGTNELINIKNMTLALPQGEFDLSGKLSWLNKLQWNTSVQFKKIDLSKELPTYPIRLDGSVVANGEVDTNNWLLNLKEVQLNGDLDNKPLQARGNVAINFNQFITADKFMAKWGENKISLNGSSVNGSLVADVNLPNLEILDENLHGNIVGNLTVKGSIKQPVIDTQLNIDKFVYQDIVLKHAILTGNAKYTDVLQGNVELNAVQLETASYAIKNATVKFSGNEQKHILTVDVDGQPASMIASLTGSLNKDRTNWSGELYDAALTVNKKNSWQLNKTIKVNYDIANSTGNVSANCWLNNKSKICLDNNVILANKGEAIVSLTDIDLGLFDTLNESDTKIAGMVHGKATIKWDPNYSIPTIIASIDSHDVYIKQQIASQTLPIPFDLFSVKANINDNQARLDWQFSINEFGKFNGNFQVDDPTGNKKLSGKLIIDKLSLAIINPLLENNDHAKGVINSNLTFSGSLSEPTVKGNLDLEHSEIKSTQLPVDVESVMIDVDFYGKSSVLKGQLKTKDGIVDIDGKANWEKLTDWNAFITVKGAAVEVTLPPMVTLSVVPDIKIEANQNQLDLTGRVSIPKATIKVESLPPSTVDVSSDEVMLNNNLQEIAPQNFGMKINSHVLVSLGNKVTLDAYGLKANLNGNVYVSQTDKGTMVNGQVNIVNGKFQAYGQDLVVRKGEIIFAGPADQPRLNVEAIRNPESIENSVTAGIRVTGLADDPKVEIFSDPSMSQQEALSYLLRGQGLDSSSDQTDNDMLTALLIGLGTSQTGNLVGTIGDTFGIKNLSLDTQGVGDSQKVVVSGYILPNLQLKYGVGIFDSLATFTLRYRLLPRLYLEVTSGLDQTVDFIYQFEF